MEGFPPDIHLHYKVIFSSYRLQKIISVFFSFLMIISLLPIGGTEHPYITSRFLLALEVFTKK